MVFNDITTDYSTFIDLLDAYSAKNNYIKASLDLLEQYRYKTSAIIETYLTSPKTSQNINHLTHELNSIEKNCSGQIARMSSSMRTAVRLITKIENINFSSIYLKEISVQLCEQLDQLIKYTEEYSAVKITGDSGNEVFFRLIKELENFKEIYKKVYENNELFKNIESELLESIPLDSTNSLEFFSLDIRSYKPESNIISFTDDLKLIADCLQHLERLVCPSETHCIYMRKVESGSLKAMFGSAEIDFSIFPDLITSISNAIKTWRLTPAEKEKALAEAEKTKAEAELIRAQAEEQHIKNEGSKFAIITSQIDYLCEKLSLDSQDHGSIEQIEKFCLPLIKYIEHNPIGSFNGVNYDISKEVHLLEDSSTNA